MSDPLPLAQLSEPAPVAMDTQVSEPQAEAQQPQPQPPAAAAQPPPLSPPPPQRPSHAHHESHASLSAAMEGLTYQPDAEEGGADETPALDTVAAAASDPVQPQPQPLPVAAASAAPLADASPPSSSPSGPVSVVTATGEVLYEVERVLAKRRSALPSGSSSSSSSSQPQRPHVSPRSEPDAFLYKVKWRGFDEKDSTWEPYVNIAQCTELMEQFWAEDEAAAREKKEKRKQQRVAAAAAAAAAATHGSAPADAAAPASTPTASPSTPARTSSSSRLSQGRLSTFPAGALECGVCGLVHAPLAADALPSTEPEDFVFCKSCFQPAHRQCSESSGAKAGGVWSCSACGMAEEMAAEEQTAEPAAAVAAVASADPSSRSEQLRTLLLAVQENVTRDSWQSVPLAAHGSSTVDWQFLSAAFQACWGHAASKAELAQLVPEEVYDHLLSQLLTPALQAGAALVLVTGDGTQPSPSDRESLLKSVNACSLTLHLLSMPDVPRRLIQEEHVRSVSEFLLHAIRDVLMPLYDGPSRDRLLFALQQQSAQASTPAKKKQKGKKAKAEEEAKVKEDEEDEEEADEEQSSVFAGVNSGYWSALQVQLRYLVHKTASLLSLLTRFQSLERFPELLAMKMSDASFAVLSLTPVTPSSDVSVMHSLQSSCSHWLLQRFIGGDAATRYSLLDSVAVAYRNLNPARRNLRTYVVHQGTQRFKASANAAIGVKKEEGAAVDATAAAESMSAAIQSSVPLPSATTQLRDQPQVSVQMLVALLCQMLQSLATQPLRTDTLSNASTSLLERIQREVRDREVAAAAAAAAEAEAAAAGASGKKKAKGSAKKSKKGADTDVDMKDGSKEEVLPTAVDTSFSALHSALDTPQVRSEFLSTLTAPVHTVHEYSIHFLRKLIEQCQPPPKDAPASSNALSRKTSKLLLRNFVEDLLQVMFTPEFPIAEQLTLHIIKLMLHIVDGKDAGRPNDGLRLISLSLLGLIAIHVKLHHAIATEHPILFRPHRKLESEEGAAAASGEEAAAPAVGEELFCICGMRRSAKDMQSLVQETGEAFLVDCDECHTWYHGLCLGFQPDTIPANWHCQQCVIRMECERQTAELQRKRDKLLSLRESMSVTSTPQKKKGKKEPTTPPAADAANAAALADVTQQLDAAGAARVSTSVLRQLIINYLNAEVVKSEDDATLYARQYDLCTWLQQAQEAERAAHKKREEEEQKMGRATPSVPSAAISPAFERDLEAVQLNWDPPAKSTSGGSVSLSAPTSSSSPTSGSNKVVLISRDVACSMSRQLALDRSLSVLKWPSRILDSLCARCNDPVPACRAAAVASIAHMVRADPAVLKDVRVKGALKRRVEDSSITTREAVVDLIGTFILQADNVQRQASASGAASPASPNDAAVSPTVVDADYYNFVIGRLNDPGISVRKKVVRILRDLCLQPQPHPRFSELCERLILCVRDSEESMQSLSVTIVYELFFDRTQARIRDRMQGAKMEPQVKVEGQAVSVPVPSSPFTPSFQQLAQLIVGAVSRLSASVAGSPAEGAECLADILLLLLEQDASLSKSSGGASGEMTSLTGLRMTLLKVKKQQKQAKVAPQQRRQSSSALSAAFEKEGSAGTKGKGKGKGAQDSSADPNSVRRICEDMVAVVVSMLVNSGAQPDVAGASATASAPASASAATPPPTMLHLIQTLHVFSQVFPPFLLPHLQTLQPYLKLATMAPVDTKQLTPAQLTAHKEHVARDMSTVSLLLDIFRETLPMLAPGGVDASGHGALLSKALTSTATSLSTNREFVVRLQADLQEILSRCPHPSLIKGAAPTFVLVCEQLVGVPEQILHMCRVCIHILWASQLAPLASNGVRAAITLSLLLKHFDVEAYLTRLNAALPLGEPRTPFWSLIYAGVKNSMPHVWARLQSKSQWMLQADNDAHVHVVVDVFGLFNSCLSTTLPATALAPGPAAEQVKRSAGSAFYLLQGIIALFSRQPPLILKAQEAIVCCLTSPHSTAEVQRQSLRALREFLQNEDRRVQKTQRAERVSKKKGADKGATPSKRKGKKKAEEEEEEEEELFDGEDDEQEEEEITLDDVAAVAVTPATHTPWHTAAVDASDYLPSLVSACEQQVYNLALSPSPHVRSESLHLMGVILHQAVTNPVDAMPTLVAALTDRHPVPQRVAIGIVTQVISRKKEWVRFMEQRFINGIGDSFDMQSRLYGATLDPLHRRNIGTPAAPVFDRTPTDGLAHAYALIKKNAVSRRQFCSKFVNELMSVTSIGIFAQEETAPGVRSPTQTMQPIASPVKQMTPHSTLNARAASNGSVGAASPLSVHSSPHSSQPGDEDSFPAFVPPAFDRSMTDFAPSPSSMMSGQSGGAASEYSAAVPQPRPASPLAFLAYIAGLCTAFTFEDDEPMHLSVHLSKIINTRGAALQSHIQATIVALKKLNGETVTDEEDLEASQSMQLAQPVEDGAALAQTAAPVEDKESLLAKLRLQCDSAVAITILIRLRQWQQESYDLTGRYEEWNIHASGGVSAAASSSSGVAARTPLKLRRVVDLPLHFHDLPLDEAQAEAMMAAQQRKAAGGQGDARKVAGRASTKSAAGAHARSASMPVHPSAAAAASRSIIPVLCQAQFACFHSSMERSAVFLATKSSKRGHKRAATQGSLTAPDDAEEGASAKKARAAPGSGGGRGKAGSRKKKAKRKRHDYDSDESDEDDDDDDEVSVVSVSRVAGSKAAPPRSAGRAKKQRQVITIDEEDEEEAEEEEEDSEQDE